MKHNTSTQAGEINPLLILSIVLGLAVIALGGFATWAYLNYTDQKNNVDSKISIAVSKAKQEQSDADQVKYLEQEKQPYRTFQGPAEFGGVTFEYPKTWSVYVDKDGSSTSNYVAYLQPGVVPPTSSKTPYATVVNIVSNDYEDVLKSLNEQVKSGKLRSSPVTINGQTGTRLDGTFTGNIEGSMVIMKVRDKTLQVSTQSNTYAKDYTNAVLATLKFNP